jgi:hypothetical protein
MIKYIQAKQKRIEMLLERWRTDQHLKFMLEGINERVLLEKQLNILHEKKQFEESQTLKDWRESYEYITNRYYIEPIMKLKSEINRMMFKGENHEQHSIWQSNLDFFRTEEKDWWKKEKE